MSNKTIVTTTGNTTSVQSPFWDTNTIWDYFPTTTGTIAAYWNEQAKASGSFPPYNITKNDDSTEFNLSMAVAGFSPEDLDVTVKDSKLIVKGEMKAKELPFGFVYSHKGIAERSFTRVVTIGEYVEVKTVGYKNGMLDISLQLVLPESKKPKKFEIKTT